MEPEIQVGKNEYSVLALGYELFANKLDLWKRMRSEILDHPDGKKEVWLVLGRTSDKAALLDQLQTPGRRSAITGQVAYLWSLLRANCSVTVVALSPPVPFRLFFVR
jgi:hypothetical protein